jgi:hypothetical protein
MMVSMYGAVAGWLAGGERTGFTSFSSLNETRAQGFTSVMCVCKFLFIRSTCPLVFFSWLLDHVIYFKLSKFTQ